MFLNTENLHNIDYLPHNTGRVNKSKMISNGHVGNTENKKYTQNLHHQSINHFSWCVIKQAIIQQSSHMMRNQLQTVSGAPVSSSQAELSYSQCCSYLLVDQGITHWQILHKVHSLITAAEAEKEHNWKHTDQQNISARSSTDTQNEKVWSHCMCKQMMTHCCSGGMRRGLQTQLIIAYAFTRKIWKWQQ